MVHEEANGLMASLSSPTDSYTYTSLPFIKRVKFLFNRSRIDVLRSLLDSSKATLNLLLVTLNIEMAKSKHADKKLMDQLQSERKVFIRVVASQNRALDEALKEVDNAKKETVKLKNKAESPGGLKHTLSKKERKKQQKEEAQNPKLKDEPKDNSLKPPPMYSLQAPSVSQFVYNPPPIDTSTSSAVMTLALSLDTPSTSAHPQPPQPSKTFPRTPSYGNDMPNMFDWFTSPPETEPTPKHPPPPPPPYVHTPPESSTPRSATERPEPAKRVFSDPGPRQPDQAPTNTGLNPGNMFRERSRSPYGAARTPQKEFPTVERKRTQGTQNQPAAEKPRASSYSVNTEIPRKPMGQGPKAQDTSGPPPSPYPDANKPSSPQQEKKQEQYTYQAYRPPQPQAVPPAEPPKPAGYPPYSPTPPPPPPPPQPTSNPNKSPPRPAIPPPPPPRLGTTYVALQPYTSREVGHLNCNIFDVVVDVVTHTPEEEALPYPTFFDASPTPKHYWQASLHDRRGARGLLPHDMLCPIDDAKLDARMKESWFSATAHLIVDVSGRVWVGPAWTFEEPKRRRSKWWADEF
ncbi:hypothetical protein B0J11DRAFT_12724 [Dendryphion nanum]|uniref:Uncharacterized protein n=1 Tax=Dendryphion nanum TaxID=256645 RepID=A0A9P9J148_9PLEO|nr:hypothetical protein B0J11DRAFT_12724 [Dendryphion nanum]